ncbi:MAG TPA: phosphoenolpyruvate--protein phosphotransferase [Terriglobales bacterium]|jgi:phosphoenolpyruvate-protein phosphotransferase|nr:phosphoenolpyruvate--protein phosphotransferase [Terriglobales bacterium]
MSPEVCNPVEFKFVCPLPNGLHARPASQLAEFASDFASDVSLTNLRTGIAANLKSTLAIISADIRSGDECSIRVAGADEASAGAALLGYITRDLPKSDEPLVESGSERRIGPLPRALLAAGIRCHFGTGVSPGIGKGASVVVGGMTLPPDLGSERAEDFKKEERRIERAMATVRERIKVMLARSVSPAEAGVLKAHLAIVEDVSLSDKIAELIVQGRSAGQALAESAQFFMSILQKSESSYIRDRAVDIQEICYRLLEEVYGSRFTAAAVELKEPSVLVAETIAPQQLLGMERKWLEGLVLEYAGRTSHAVILARSLGIPTVVGVKDAPVLFSGERELVVDANRGLVVPNGTAAVKRFYDREYQAQQKRNETLTRNKFRPAVTVDGLRLEVAANVSSAEEVAAACANGAEGIGLFRTEMLFIGHDRAPSEEEQFAIYKQAAQAAGQRPVIIRTIDIGGDKPVPHLNLPAESNPFLGYRGMRIYAEHRELFRTQLRAVLRASAFGKLQIMAPMVSTIEEVIWLKGQVAQSQDELRNQNITFDPAMPVGIMIEVPSVAFILDQLCAEVDFFSIGTNDLNQYFLAVDRDNAKVAALSSVRHPSFVRFLKHIVDGVHANGKWIGMCGEMAGDVRNLPILIGLGLDEISASASQVPALKERVSQLYAKNCEDLLSRITACTQAEQVNKLLAEDHPSESSQSLLDPNLVIVGSDSESKEEAIRELIDSLFIAGRTENPDRLEEVVWAREAAYSTGLGHGFAIPHCRSDLITANSIAVLKLQRPIEWNSLDGKPVQMVVLLAVHESDANNSHMKMLAKLARKLMNEEFRDHLMKLNDSGSILSYLSQELEIPL